MKSVYVNSLLNLLEKKNSKMKINEFNEKYVLVDNTPIYFSKNPQEMYFSLQREENSIYIEFRSSEIFIDASKLQLEPESINYKTILPIISPEDRENIKILLMFLISENSPKIQKNKFVSNLMKMHSHNNIDKDALKNLFEKSLIYLEKVLINKKSKIAFSEDEINIKYSLKDIDKIASFSTKKDTTKIDDVKLLDV